MRSQQRFIDKSVKLQAKRAKKMQSKGSHVTKCMFFTLSFFFTTVPYSLFYALKLNNELSNPTARNIVIGVLSLLQYVRHAGNFLIYLLTSSIIKNEMKAILQSLIKWILSSPIIVEFCFSVLLLFGSAIICQFATNHQQK